jgi:hypothetical protein
MKNDEREFDFGGLRQGDNHYLIDLIAKILVISSWHSEVFGLRENLVLLAS